MKNSIICYLYISRISVRNALTIVYFLIHTIMKTTINETINKIIGSYVPKNKRLVSFIMDALNLSRESAYRRLRNEIPYTVQEITILSSIVDFSIDEMMGYTSKEKAYFHLNKSDATSVAESYRNALKSVAEVMNDIAKYGYSKVIFTGNRLPLAFLLEFEKLSKLNYFKWVIQSRYASMNSCFFDMTIPSEIDDIHREYIQACRKTDRVVSIYDENIISALVKTIWYYYRRSLISDEELHELSNEMKMVLDKLEYLAFHGAYGNGPEIALYISELDIESNNTFFEYNDRKSLLSWSASIGPIVIHNQSVCEEQEAYIRSVLKHSTLISLSNEINRIDFFTRQRKIIEQLDNNQDFI